MEDKFSKYSKNKLTNIRTYRSSKLSVDLDFVMQKEKNLVVGVVNVDPIHGI